MKSGKIISRMDRNNCKNLEDSRTLSSIRIRTKLSSGLEISPATKVEFLIAENTEISLRICSSLSGMFPNLEILPATFVVFSTTSSCKNITGILSYSQEMFNSKQN